MTVKASEVQLRPGMRIRYKVGLARNENANWSKQVGNRHYEGTVAEIADDSVWLIRRLGYRPDEGMRELPPAWVAISRLARVRSVGEEALPPSPLAIFDIFDEIARPE